MRSISRARRSRAVSCGSPRSAPRASSSTSTTPRCTPPRPPRSAPCPHVAEPHWQRDALAPLADAGWSALVAAEDDELETLALVWRPRALALAGRAGELSRDDVVRGRLEQRVAEVSARMQRALEAGDEDEAERLHARAIELGTVLAGRLAAEWRA